MYESLLKPQVWKFAKAASMKEYRLVWTINKTNQLKVLKVWWHAATLFVYFSYIYDIHTFISSHSYNTLVRRHSPRSLSISSSLWSSVRKTSLWCRAENRTRACLTASRRSTNWATPHHTNQLKVTYTELTQWGNHWRKCKILLHTDPVDMSNPPPPPPIPKPAEYRNSHNLLSRRGNPCTH